MQQVAWGISKKYRESHASGIKDRTVEMALNTRVELPPPQDEWLSRSDQVSSLVVAHRRRMWTRATTASLPINWVRHRQPYSERRLPPFDTLMENRLCLVAGQGG
jgi:hypothetical protein